MKGSNAEPVEIMAMNFMPLPRVGRVVVNGTMSSEEAVQICLERIGKSQEVSRNFVSLHPQEALAEAQARDKEPSRGPLHGVPFAVKNIFDTAGFSTGLNPPDSQPTRDAAAVAMFRAAGAVFLGRVATEEFGPGVGLPESDNRYHAEFTPGGSSAGSGAAVGGGSVPLALATQTAGSTIRPASFCGAAAFKPTWGRVPVEGMRPFAPSLDTVGWIAEDCDLLMRAASACGIGEDKSAVVGRLRIGMYKTPYFSEAEEETIAALEKTIILLERAGHRVETVQGPAGAQFLNSWQNTLMHAEGRDTYLAELGTAPSMLHPGVLGVLNGKLGITHDELKLAYDSIAVMRQAFEAAMNGFDAWLSPAVTGEPPKIEKGNDLASFNRLFTALHLPCVTLPGFSGPYGLPVGIQLIAPRFADSHLLQTAQLVEELINL